jgi:hypothetical protein
MISVARRSKVPGVALPGPPRLTSAAGMLPDSSYTGHECQTPVCHRVHDSLAQTKE